MGVSAPAAPKTFSSWTHFLFSQGLDGVGRKTPGVAHRSMHRSIHNYKSQGPLGRDFGEI